MATNPEFVQYIADQLHSAGVITYRKMFGEYGMYLDGKIFSLICDNQFFVKITEGAKPYFLVEELDDREWLTELAVRTWKELPVPKPKKKKMPKKEG